MALSKLTISVGMIAIPVRVDNLIGKGTKPSGNYVCGVSKTQLTRVGGGNKSGSFCEEKHDGRCEQVIGYPRPDGSFFVPDTNDLDQIAGEKDGAIKLDHFVAADEIDPAYFEKHYAVRPDDKANETQRRAFWLLTARLQKQGASAVGSATLDKDEKMVFLRYSKAFECLIFTVGYFDEQIKHDLLAAAKQGRPETFTRAEQQLADAMIKTYADIFAPTDYQPERWHKLTALVEAAGASASGAVAKAEALNPADTPDLLAQLKATVDGPKKPRRATRV